MRHEGQDVDRLEEDEYEEDSMVASANTHVEPRAVMVVSLDTHLTQIAMVTPWKRDDLALEADLMGLEKL